MDRAFLLSLSSLSWKRHPSDHPLGHPVLGFTKVYVPLGHITESVSINFIPELSVRGARNKFYMHKRIYEYRHRRKQ